MNNGEARLLRIFISNTDKLKFSSLSETIVYAARRNGLAGATVLKGIMGYGSSSMVYSYKFWEITDKMPVVIEIIDEPEKIEKFIEKILPWFDKVNTGCMISVEKVNIVLYKTGKKKVK